MKKAVCFILAFLSVVLVSCNSKSVPLYVYQEEGDVVFEYAYYEYIKGKIRRLSDVESAGRLSEYCESNSIENEKGYIRSVLESCGPVAELDTDEFKSDGFCFVFDDKTYVIMYEKSNDLTLICCDGICRKLTDDSFVPYIKEIVGFTYLFFFDCKNDQKERYKDYGYYQNERYDLRFYYDVHFYDRNEFGYYLTYDDRSESKRVKSKSEIAYIALTRFPDEYGCVTLYKDDDAEMWFALLSNENMLDDECDMFIDIYGNVIGANFMWCYHLMDGYPNLKFILQRLLKEYDAYYISSIHTYDVTDNKYWQVFARAEYEDGTEKTILSIVCDNKILISREYTKDAEFDYKKLFDELERECNIK